MVAQVGPRDRRPEYSRGQRRRELDARVAQLTDCLARQEGLASHRVGQGPALHAARGRTDECLHDIGRASAGVQGVEAEAGGTPCTVDVGDQSVEDRVEVADQLDVVMGQAREAEDSLGMAQERLRRRRDPRGGGVALVLEDPSVSGRPRPRSR